MKKTLVLTIVMCLLGIIVWGVPAMAQDSTKVDTVISITKGFSTVVVFGANFPSSPTTNLGTGVSKAILGLYPIAPHFKTGFMYGGTGFGENSATEMTNENYALVGIYHNSLKEDWNLGFFMKFALGAQTYQGQTYELLQVTGGGLYYGLNKDVTLLGGIEGSTIDPGTKTNGTTIYAGLELAPF